MVNPPARQPIEVVCGVLHDADGRVLLARRPPGGCHAGLWEFAGGKVHLGETPEQALVREWREELGVVIAVGQALVPEPAATSRGEPILLLPFHVRLVAGAPVPLEHSELRWTAPSEIPKLPLAPGDALIAARLF